MAGGAIPPSRLVRRPRAGQRGALGGPGLPSPPFPSPSGGERGAFPRRRQVSRRAVSGGSAGGGARRPPPFTLGRAVRRSGAAAGLRGPGGAAPPARPGTSSHPRGAARRGAGQPGPVGREGGREWTRAGCRWGRVSLGLAPRLSVGEAVRDGAGAKVLAALSPGAGQGWAGRRLWREAVRAQMPQPLSLLLRVGEQRGSIKGVQWLLPPCLQVGALWESNWNAFLPGVLGGKSVFLS